MKITPSKLLNNYLQLTQGFTTKQSGNLAFHVHDDVESVLHNHKRLAESLGYDTRTLVHMKQIHSNSVHKVEDTDTFENPPTCDALITNRVNTPLMVMVADCSPILFYDDVKKVIAVAHAGRAGAFTNIIANVIESFRVDFNSNVADISASIGPAIGSCCYEVGAEIYDEAKELKLAYAIDKKENSYHLDIRKILHNQLLNAGLLEQNIEISSLCNCCEADTYFSYRAQNQTGRFCGLLMLS